MSPFCFQIVYKTMTKIREKQGKTGAYVNFLTITRTDIYGALLQNCSEGVFGEIATRAKISPSQVSRVLIGMSNGIHPKRAKTKGEWRRILQVARTVGKEWQVTKRERKAKKTNEEKATPQTAYAQGEYCKPSAMMFWRYSGGGFCGHILPC